MRLFDAYERLARIAPILVALFPIILTVGIIGLYAKLGLQVPLLFFSLVLLVPVSRYARKRGRKVQSELWEKWGGSPLAKMLANPSDRPLSEVLRQKSITQLYRLYPEETPCKGPEDAYEVIATLAATRARVSQSSVVASENSSYGFIRNAYGIRWHGIMLAIVSAVSLMIYTINSDHNFNILLNITGIVISLSCLLWWIVGVTENVVREAGNIYASAVIRWLAAEVEPIE